jgi:hypothetical protein
MRKNDFHTTHLLYLEVRYARPILRRCHVIFPGHGIQKFSNLVRSLPGFLCTHRFPRSSLFLPSHLFFFPVILPVLLPELLLVL